jgi:hypothetical protein
MEVRVKIQNQIDVKVPGEKPEHAVGALSVACQQVAGSNSIVFLRHRAGFDRGIIWHFLTDNVMSARKFTTYEM